MYKIIFFLKKKYLKENLFAFSGLTTELSQCFFACFVISLYVGLNKVYYTSNA